MESQAVETNPQVEEASGVYLGQWSRLVSTTNWEKGRIVHEWRTALEEAGAPREAASDEAWGRRVGNVSGQHVGRLRRVWERFAEGREQFPGLYWSHFQAALDWHDAEMWLEGAVQSGWSIAQMRLQRWEATGGHAADEPREEDVVAAEYDEDFSPAGHAAPDDRAETNGDGDLPDFAGRERADDAESGEEGDDAGPVPFDADAPFIERDTQQVRPFAELAALPADLQDALESFKLAIVRHKLTGWSEVSRDDVLGALDALRALALAPAE